MSRARLGGVLVHCAAHQQSCGTWIARTRKLTHYPTARQLEDLLKADHAQNWKDLEKMARLVAAARTGARRNAHYVLPVQSLGNLERIETLGKTIRARMKRDQACCLIY